jgi:hypothetical protein
MNKRKPPRQRRLSHRLGDRGADPSRVGGQRAWRREISQLPDEELIAVVRAMVAVDHAVNTYRKRDIKAVFIQPAQTRTP